MTGERGDDPTALSERVLRRLRQYFWGRLAYAVLQRLFSGEISLRAMGLAYLTLLALVPLLAVSFAVLKAFGVHDQLEPVLLQVLAPLGDKSAEITRAIIDFVEDIRVGVLGSAGIAFLFYTIITLVRRIEASVNAIWHIPNNRSFARTFSDYLSVILIAPVLLFSAVGLRTNLLTHGVVLSLLAVEPLGTLAFWVGQILPYLLLCATFAFLYGFIPNTQVRAGAAIAGGLFAGLLWSATGWLFASFVVQSSNYSAVYSGFAGVMLFILWLQLAWLIVLLGAQVAFCWQYPQSAAAADDDENGQRPPDELLALATMTLVGRAHRDGRALSRHDIAAELDLDAGALDAVLERLLDKRLLAETQTPQPTLLPGRELQALALAEVIDAVSDENDIGERLPTLAALSGRLDAAGRQVLADMTVADLLAEAAGQPVRPPYKP